MASDLAPLPRAGITVELCGDAHVRNLGAYAAPDGRLVFDINDFDETMPGPWEWDVKRLATSLVLASQESGQAESRQDEAVRTFVRSYRAHLREFARMPVARLARQPDHTRSGGTAAGIGSSITPGASHPREIYEDWSSRERASFVFTTNGRTSNTYPPRSPQRSCDRSDSIAGRSTQAAAERSTRTTRRMSRSRLSARAASARAIMWSCCSATTGTIRSSCK